MVTVQDFIEATGRYPQQDDMARCNCNFAGEVGHSDCGWCDCMDRPVFQGGCDKSRNRGVCHRHD